MGREHPFSSSAFKRDDFLMWSIPGDAILIAVNQAFK